MLNDIQGVLSPSELDQIRDWLGQATWSSGAYSAGAEASQLKHNEEMNQQGEPWESINKLVVGNLYANSEFQSLALPLKVSAAFVSRCKPGMRYGQHIDNPIMGSAHSRYRSDIAVTVFLSEPDDYEGGELKIESRFGSVSVKLNAGSAVVYPASSLHEVSTVERGERLVCVLWVQSMVRDAEQRHLLHDLNEAHLALLQTTPKAQVTKRIGHAYTNLLRMWADT